MRRCGAIGCRLASVRSVWRNHDFDRPYGTNAAFAQYPGIRGSGYLPVRIGTEPTIDDARPVPPYVPRFRNVTDRHPDFIRGYHFQGGGGCAEYPAWRMTSPASARPSNRRSASITRR